MNQSKTNGASESVGTKLLFENDRVRVWDLALQPGESVGEHIHRHDYFFMVINGGDLQQADPDAPDNPREMHFEDNKIVFSEAGEGIVHQRLTNIGDKPYRNIVVELKS